MEQSPPQPVGSDNPSDAPMAGSNTKSGASFRGGKRPQLEGFTSTCSMQGKVVFLTAEVQMAAHPDVVFDLLADPNKHSEIFEAIEGVNSRLLEEKGPWRKYEVDYQARWKFWMVNGKCENRMFMETNSENRTVSFRLREPGFLLTYQGTWVVKPAIPQAHELQQQVGSAIDNPRLAGGAMSSQRQLPRLGSFRRAGSSLKRMGSNTSSFVSRLGSGLRAPSINPHGLPQTILRMEDLRMGPKQAPPRFLGGLLKGQVMGQVKGMLQGIMEASQPLEVDGTGIPDTKRPPSNRNSLQTRALSDQGSVELTIDGVSTPTYHAQDQQ